MLALLKGVLNMEKDDGRKVSQEDLAAWLMNQMIKFQPRGWMPRGTHRTNDRI